MGCGASAPGDDSQIGGGDMEITQTNHLRVLLLGSSGSGKSTFCKQLLRHFGGGFTEQELLEGGYELQSNLLQRMNNSLSSEGVEFSNLSSVAAKEKLGEAAQCEFEFIEGNFFSSEICKCMQVLWGDKKVSEMAERCYFKAPWDFKFFKDIPRIFGSAYNPEDDDIVGLRMPTSGTAEYGIQTDSGLGITVVDIGGKRNDRNYASAQSMIGDAFSYLGNDAAVKHRYLENLSIFGKVFASVKMDKIPVFVVFTKPDLFEEMIKAKEPAMCEEYPEYDGPESDPDCAEDFLRHKMHRVAQVANFGKALDLPSFVVNLQDNDQFVEIFERVCELLNEHSLQQEYEQREER